jgi:hypothetical protein
VQKKSAYMKAAEERVASHAATRAASPDGGVDAGDREARELEGGAAHATTSGVSEHTQV